MLAFRLSLFSYYLFMIFFSLKTLQISICLYISFVHVNKLFQDYVQHYKNEMHLLTFLVLSYILNYVIIPVTCA